MKTIKGYHDLYLKCEVLLLANVLFRNNNWKHYGLCPNHYWSAPGLCWDVMLKITKVRSKLIKDPGMYIFFEKVTMGGIYYIFNR